MPAHHLPMLFETVVARACRIVPELSHVDPARLFVCVRKLPPTRLGQTVGLRYAGLSVDGREVLYVVTFSARLLSSAFADRMALETVMHELWHVAEACDGTIRPARHGKRFDATVRTLCDAYLQNGGPSLPPIGREERVRVRRLRGRTVLERTTTLAKLIPATKRYACPAGHVVVRNRRLSRPSSCATCSPTFDRRFLLSPVSD